MNKVEMVLTLQDGADKVERAANQLLEAAEALDGLGLAWPATATYRADVERLRGDVETLRDAAIALVGQEPATIDETHTTVQRPGYVRRTDAAT